MTILAEQIESVYRKFQWATKIENLLYRFFNFITICPIDFSQNSDQNRIKIKFKRYSRFFSILGMAAIFLYVSAILIVRIFIFHSESELSIWNEVTNLCGITFTCLIILIETQLTHQHFANFLHLKQKTENDLLELCYRERFQHEKYLYMKNYWRILLAFQLIAWTTEAINIIDMNTDRVLRFYCCSVMIPIMIMRFRCFQHRLYTSTMNFYIKMIRLKIEDSINDIENNESLARQQNRKQFTMNSQRIFNDLNLSMKIFTSIFRMTCLVNKMFGFSLLMNIFESFIQLLSNLFWIYSKLYHEDTTNVSGLLLNLKKNLPLFLNFKHLFNL